MPVLLFKAAVIGAALYLFTHSHAFIPVAAAIVLAFMLYPIVRALQRPFWGSGRRRLGIGAAILLSFLGTGVFVFMVAAVLFTPLIEEFGKLYKNIPQILTGFQGLLVEFEKNILLPLAKSGIYDAQSEQIIAFLQKLITGGLAFSFNLIKNVANLSVNFVAKMVEFIVVPVLVFYFIKDWRQMMAGFVSLFHARHRGKAELILLEMGEVVSAFLRGQLLLCVLVGVLMFCGLSLLRIEYPLVLALLAGIAEAVPVIGPVLSSVPAIFIGVLASPYIGFKVALFCFFIQQVENHIIVPKVMGGSIRLHPAGVIVSILVAGQYFGLLGMVMALPAVALVKVLMKHFWITEENYNGETGDHG